MFNFLNWLTIVLTFACLFKCLIITRRIKREKALEIFEDTWTFEWYPLFRLKLWGPPLELQRIKYLILACVGNVVQFIFVILR